MRVLQIKVNFHGKLFSYFALTSITLMIANDYNL